MHENNPLFKKVLGVSVSAWETTKPNRGGVTIIAINIFFLRVIVILSQLLLEERERY